MAEKIKAQELRKFAKVVCRKSVDLDDVRLNDTYEEYIEYQSTFVNFGATDSKNVLEEDEFNLCKEVMKAYAK